MMVDVEDLHVLPPGIYVRHTKGSGEPRYFPQVSRGGRSYSGGQYKHPAQALVALINLGAELDAAGIKQLKRGAKRRGRKQGE